MQIQGTDMLWSDFLSLWVNVPACIPVEPPSTKCTAQLFDGVLADMPSRNAVRPCQEGEEGAARRCLPVRARLYGKLMVSFGLRLMDDGFY